MRALADALAWVAEARRLWGRTPDTMPPLSKQLPPCAHELRQHLVPARRCAEVPIAWEDPAGLTRPQALCVAQLALSLARWGALPQGSTPAASPAPPPTAPARAVVRRPTYDGFTADPEEDSP